MADISGGGCRYKYDGRKFFGKWLDVFAPGLTLCQYEQFIKDAFVWHVFSFGLLPERSFLTGDEARAAYNAARKSGAEYILLWSDENEPLPLPEKYSTAEKIKEREAAELYIVGKNFEWTYVETHETSCGLGPYFMRAPARG